MKSLIKLAVLFSMVVGMAACGGGDDDAQPDARLAPDARPMADAMPTVDAGPEVCGVDTAGYGTPVIAAAAQNAEYPLDGMGMPQTDNVHYIGAMNADQDQIDIQLFKDFGTSTYHGLPGTYQLTGVELNYATCGVCVQVFSDVTMGGFGQRFMATGGTVTLTQIGPNLVGTIDNIEFEHVTGGTMAENFVTTPAADAAMCKSSITTFAYDTPIVMGM